MMIGAGLAHFERGKKERLTKTFDWASRQCHCNAFQFDLFGDHLQTCQVKSAATQVHDWVVYKLSGILGSVGHRVKIHKITPAQGKERGDLEVRDYVVLQKP